MRVICIKDTWYESNGEPYKEVAPKKDSIYEVIDIIYSFPRGAYLALEGFPYYWEAKAFREIDDTFAEKVLEKVIKEVETETIEV